MSSKLQILNFTGGGIVPLVYPGSTPAKISQKYSQACPCKISQTCIYHCTKTEVFRKGYLSVKDIFSKCDQMNSFLRIWSHLLKKSLMENFIFCAIQHWIYQLLKIIPSILPVLVTGPNTYTYIIEIAGEYLIQLLYLR